MISRPSLVFLAIGGLVAGSAHLRAQELPTATPESVGLSSERLDAATRRLQSHVDAGDIAGVVAAVVRHGRLAYLEALGELDRERSLAMRDDALFRLYSMTRPITSLAAMILWEEDRFELDDPVSLYLPEFADQRVFVDASNPDLAASRPRRTEMTVEHLLMHTSGLGSRGSPIYRAEQVRTAIHHAAPDGEQRRPRAALRGPGDALALRHLHHHPRPAHRDLVRYAVRRTPPATGLRAARDDRYRVSGRFVASQPLRTGLPSRTRRRAAAVRHRGSAIHRAAGADRGRRRSGLYRRRLPSFRPDVPQRRRARRCACSAARYRRPDDRQPSPRRPPADRLRHPAARPRMDPRVLCSDGRRRVPAPGPRGHLLVGWLLRNAVLHRVARP